MQQNLDLKLIAFDFDGVIVDSLEQNIKITNEVCGKFGAEVQVTKDFLQSVEYMSFDNIAEKIRLPYKYFKPALDEINHKLVESYNMLTPFEGIFETLSNLYKLNIHLDINTHNTIKAVEPFLRKFNMLYFFSEILAAETPGDKAEKMFTVLDNSQICSCSAMLIGDSSGDIKDALSAGVIPAGVSWGFQNPEKLEKTGATIIFNNPEEIFEYINLAIIK
jgi:phosphoglycolate phosphatase